VGNSVAVFNKTKIELPYDPAVPLLGLYPKEFKGGTQTDTCIPMFIAALFIITRRWKQSKWINHMYPYNVILFNQEKE